MTVQMVGYGGIQSNLNTSWCYAYATVFRWHHCMFGGKHWIARGIVIIFGGVLYMLTQKM